jgi:hypothetical protein
VSIVGRVYLDPGDRFAGYYDPPRLCRAVAGPGPLAVPPEYPWLHLELKPGKREKRGGPRNALVVYEDGSQAVVPINRRLRLVRGGP